MSTHHLADKEYCVFFDQYQPTNICFGDGVMVQLCEHLMLNGCRFAQVVIGGHASSLGSGAFEQLINMSMSFDLETPIFRDVPAEPDMEAVRSLVAELEKNQPDTLIAIGGGSVMDAAKAAYLSWQSGLDVSELFGVNQASLRFPGKKFRRVICLPTTAGTGSEVTPYANIIDSAAHVKKLIMDDALVPEFALVDPAFTLSAPPALIVHTALDAMTHAVESLLNIHAPAPDPDSQKWALLALRLIVKALPAALRNPHDPAAREFLAAAATLGGMCIKCRPTSLPHLASFSCSGKIAHGMAVAAFLPVFWNFYLESPEVRRTTMDLANIFPSEEPQTSPEQVVDACRAFIASVSGVRKLSDLPGFDAQLIADIAGAASGNPMKLASAPRPVHADQAAQILSSILSGAL